MQLKAGAFNHLTAIASSAAPPTDPVELELTSQSLVDNLVVGFEHLDERTHPFIALRSQLMKHVRETGQRVFAVTSVQPGNGKTHVGLNLAAALSRVVPTMLIELDLRRPTLGSRLGLDKPAVGIDDFLDGTADWGASGERISGFDLIVHRVRKPRTNPSVLLASPRLQQLFETLRELDDAPICIIDTPPVFIDDDFMLIAPGLDGVLMIVEEGRTTRRALRDTIDAIRPAPVLGAVLNKSLSSAASRIDYGYDHYYDARPRRWIDRVRAAWRRRWF